ncbi:hypothetical protein L6452_23209 [Arctium lappa]|uniref:Uncharacterized protein n=1 Tax=Arctium lappa TaxID=4217 RepID=A0ACB9B203_ARCLA|nr:hypothetical protein L6452_23209 [Arctium lappa]
MPFLQNINDSRIILLGMILPTTNHSIRHVATSYHTNQSWPHTSHPSPTSIKATVSFLSPLCLSIFFLIYFYF